MKTCTTCERSLRLFEFYAQPNSHDGHMAVCKECHKARVRMRAVVKRDYIREYEYNRARRPERMAKRVEYQRAKRKRDPIKYKAWTAVGNAIRDGRLTRMSCRLCGDPESQAHHDDYTKPLDVEWLCFKCHREHAHGQMVG